MQKKAFGSEIIVQNQLRKKSVRVQERSKCVQKAFKTVRDYVTFYVKRRDFQDLKWHDFVFLQGKALQGVKKRSDWKNRSRAVFSSKWSKPSFLKTDWKKPI
jgi:hypothetical protein